MNFQPMRRICAARGGLDKQAAILPMIGSPQMTVLDMKLAETPRYSDRTPVELSPTRSPRSRRPRTAAG